MPNRKIRFIATELLTSPGIKEQAGVVSYTSFRRALRVTVPCATDVRPTGGRMAEHSSSLRFPQWQPQYQAGLMELNHSTLLGRVIEAEYAIFRRLQSLERAPNHESRFVELLAIEDALASLRLLKREQVDSPA